MRARTCPAALFAAVALAGCAEGRDAANTPNEELTVAADTSAGYSTAAPAPVVPVQGGRTVGGPLTATGQFRTVDPLAGGEGPPGSLTVREDSAGTLVSLQVSGYPQGFELEAAIVRGACEAASAATVAHSGVMQVGTGGVLSRSFTAPVPTAQVLDGAHAAQLRHGGRVIACAELPAVS